MSQESKLVTESLEVLKEANPAQMIDIAKTSESFIASLDVRNITKAAYKNGLESFISWLSSRGIIQPDRESVLAFKSALYDSGHAANTINTYLVAVKQFFSWLEGMRLYPNVAKDIRGLKQAQGHLREALTIDQVRQLLSIIDTSTLQGKRDYAIINLMARTGLRSIEVVRASIEDLRQEGGEALLFVQGKGRDSKDAFVILTEKALRPILAWLSARDRGSASEKLIASLRASQGQIRAKFGEIPLFCSLSDRNYGKRLTTKTVREIVKINLKHINICSGKISAHSLRHTFATLSLRAGAPLIQVKDALRHASIETTQKYLHNLDRIEHAAERYLDF